MDLKSELASIEEQVKALDARKREIYRLSESAPEDEKACPDWLAGMLAEAPLPRMQYPIQVHGISWAEDSKFIYGSKSDKTRWVAIRPCSGDGVATYLGIHLGEIALGASVRYDQDSGVLSFAPAMHNPAIFVPDLGRLVFGMESWWGDISSPADLKKITDTDIENVWYVRALADMSAGDKKPA